MQRERDKKRQRVKEVIFQKGRQMQDSRKHVYPHERERDGSIIIIWLNAFLKADEHSKNQLFISFYNDINSRGHEANVQPVNV